MQNNFTEMFLIIASAEKTQTVLLCRIELPPGAKDKTTSTPEPLIQNKK